MEKQRTRSSEAIANKTVANWQSGDVFIGYKKNRSASVEKKQKNLFLSQTNKSTSGNGIQFKYCVEEEREVLTDCLKERGFIHVGIEEDWNLFWGISKKSVEKILQRNLKENQFVNHFSNCSQITKKDLMALNWRKYKGKRQEEDFVPETFVLPDEFFEFKKSFDSLQKDENIWILKPSDRSRSIGIKLITSLEDIPLFLKDKSKKSEGINWATGTHVISKYIKNPLQINGKKFDLRIYVLVTSFEPLECWIYSQGFARFCSERYSLDPSQLNNNLAHITNTSFQGENLKEKNLDLKWHFDKLFSYLGNLYGKSEVDLVQKRIRKLIFQSLSSCKGVIHHSEHAFQLFGYDVLIDDKLKPWLMEVNGSPSLSATDEFDFELKSTMVGEVVDLVFSQKPTTMFQFIEEEGIL